jgi:hypothetical protein
VFYAAAVSRDGRPDFQHFGTVAKLTAATCDTQACGMGVGVQNFRYFRRPANQLAQHCDVSQACSPDLPTTKAPRIMANTIPDEDRFDLCSSVRERGTDENRQNLALLD